MSQADSKLSRRRVFAGAGTAGALAAAAAVLPTAQQPVPVDAKSAPPEPKEGYRVTQHVLRYYETTRI